MKFDNHILVIIFIVSLFFIILTEGTYFSQSSSNEDEIYDDIKNTFRPALDDAKENLGPISPMDFDLDDAKEALGPIPSIDEAKEALGPASSSILDKAKEAMGPISPAALDEAKEALGPAAAKAKEALAPISPAAIEEAKKALGPASDKAKEALGPASSNIIDKARDKLDSITSWITKNKEQVSSETQQESDPKEALGPASSLDPYGILDGAKQKFDSLLDSISQEKTQISQKESAPVSSIDIDKDIAQKTMGPVIAASPTSSSAPVLSEDSDLSKILDEAKEKSGSVTTPITQNKEETSSEDGSSRGPISAPAPAPISPSTFEEAKHAIGSYSSKALDAAKEKFSSISSYISENKLQISPASSDIKLHATPVYLDHDVVLAIESMIKQAETNSQLAIDEAKTLFSDPIVDTSDTGKCVKKCLSNYESCNLKLNKAMEDLRARNVELLTDDIGAVEGEIYDCQKCFQEHTEKQSPFNDLEEATIKATRECLNVLDHSG